jgi:hypothetical protein
MMAAHMPPVCVNSAGRPRALRVPITSAYCDAPRVRPDHLDTGGKQQLLDLLGVRAEVTGYHPCATCGGTGYAPIPADSQRHWPPSCPSCHRLKVLPDLTVDIGQAHLLLPQPGTGLGAQSAG